jgi:hypothetical protein
MLLNDRSHQVTEPAKKLPQTNLPHKNPAQVLVEK